ncbi:hypothetical protein BpHYR1_053827 [Brachionus plicatilis]|uniref:Uncharacterized protein n=1 Tax=Brachionus plicatilis TaxID=10195 RepID=A0A3M7R4Z7_BRAPC|nr:hypothetical protein BpHYR1_053827 [Brachionus plicatilis]
MSLLSPHEATPLQMILFIIVSCRIDRINLQHLENLKTGVFLQFFYVMCLISTLLSSVANHIPNDNSASEPD